MHHWFKRQERLTECAPPDGSRVVALGHFPECLIELYDGSDGHGYFVVRPKLCNLRGRLELVDFLERVALLAEGAKRPAPRRYAVFPTAGTAGDDLLTPADAALFSA
jgi:hypothetical protein